jgi:hypothetical protein
MIHPVREAVVRFFLSHTEKYGCGCCKNKTKPLSSLYIIHPEKQTVNPLARRLSLEKTASGKAENFSLLFFPGYD